MKIKQEEFEIILNLAQNAVFEPFETRASIESIQKTLQGMQRQIDRLKKKSTPPREKIKVRAQEFWQKNQNRFSFLQSDETKFSQKAKAIKTEVLIVDKILSHYSPDWLNQPKTSKRRMLLEEALMDVQTTSKNEEQNLSFFSPPALGALTRKTTQKIRSLGKNFYTGSIEKLTALSMEYAENAIQRMIRQQGKEKLHKRINKVLDRTDINTDEDIRNLTNKDRQKIIKAVYPYGNDFLMKHQDRFNRVINLTLGITVATNIPLTGIGVSLINAVKTIVRTANRLHLLSQLHGYPIIHIENLYRVTGMVLSSMNDWQNNAEHRPLEPEIIEILYHSPTQNNFQDLLKEVALKEAYIAIPIIGMVSLGKIQIDDLMIDETVLQLTQNYHKRRQIIKEISESDYTLTFDRLKEIFQKLKEEGFIQKQRKFFEKDKNGAQNILAGFNDVSHGKLQLLLKEEAEKRYIDLYQNQGMENSLSSKELA